MRDWIIKHWALSYDSKVFGVTFRHLRVVNTLVPLLMLGGLYNVLTVGFDFWQALALVPFFAVGIYVSFIFKLKPTVEDYEKMDWEQVLQYSKLPEHLVSTKERLDLQKDWKVKYKGKEKFVEAWRFFSPTVWTIVGMIIFAIFGFHEAGFTDQRFF